MKFIQVSSGQLRPDLSGQLRRPPAAPLMLGGYRTVGGEGLYRPPLPGLSPLLMHRSGSLEMLNNIKFEEKRALIASTLSLNDLLKPSGDYRSPLQQPSSKAQFNPAVSNGYMVPHSLYKTNGAGYNVNFLNNGIPEKDLGRKINPPTHTHTKLVR